MDWKTLENSLVDSARATLEALLDDGVGPLYGAAFHASYREEERVIDLPSFAANSLAALDEDHPRRKQEGFWGVQWNPADWRWDWLLDDYANAALSALEAPLQAYANRAGPDVWAATEQRFLRTVARAAKALNRIYAKDPRVAKDFIVFFHDEYGGPELAAKSLSPRQFLHHFPEQDATEQERRRVAALADDQQVNYYLSCLSRPQPIDGEEASRWLIARGASATAALVHLLQKGPERWRAAMILGLAGWPRRRQSKRCVCKWSTAQSRARAGGVPTRWVIWAILTGCWRRRQIPGWRAFRWLAAAPVSGRFAIRVRSQGYWITVRLKPCCSVIRSAQRTPRRRSNRAPVFAPSATTISRKRCAAWRLSMSPFAAMPPACSITVGWASANWHRPWPRYANASMMLTRRWPTWLA
jgi:hypothetical protein